MNTSPAQFNGFHAKFKNDAGEIYIAKVINEGVGKSGAKLFKIRKKIVVGYDGWSGGCKPVYAYADPIFVFQTRIVRA